MALLAFFVLALGVWPEPLTHIMHTSVNDLLRHVAISKLQ
jgi:NADH-quinone oxidoreductase subunit M